MYSFDKNLTMRCHFYGVRLLIIGGTCGIMVTIIENGPGDPSSNPGQGCLHFTLERNESNYSSSSHEQIVE